MPLTARTGMCVNTALLMKCVSYTNTILVCLVLSTTFSFNFLTIFDVFKSFVGCIYDSASKLTASPSKHFSEHCSQLFASVAAPIGQNSPGRKLFCLLLSVSLAHPVSMFLRQFFSFSVLSMYYQQSGWNWCFFYDEVITWLSLA